MPLAARPRSRSSGRIAHIRSIRSGLTRRLAVAGIAATCWLLCRFPHLKPPWSVNMAEERARRRRLSKARAGQKHRTPAYPAAAIAFRAEARAALGPRPGACFCFYAKAGVI